MPESREVVVIGGGQAGLAAGYYLRRAGLDYVILDAQSRPGGAWGHGWDCLRLFSPAEYSPLPGWGMPRQEGEGFPTSDHVVDYLRAYEQRYDLPLRRPVRVRAVRPAGERLAVDTTAGSWLARYVISATGTWECPYVPDIPGRHDFAGRQLHTVDYTSPEPFRGQRVVIVGGGNSAAQILAEVSRVADPPGSPCALRGSCRTTSTAGSCSAWPPATPPRTAWRVAASPASATSSWCPASATPATGVSCTPNPCSSGSPPRHRMARRHRAALRRRGVVHRLPPEPHPPRAPRIATARRRRRHCGHPLGRRTSPLPAGVRRLDRSDVCHSGGRRPHREGHRRRHRRPDQRTGNTVTALPRPPVLPAQC